MARNVSGTTRYVSRTTRYVSGTTRYVSGTTRYVSGTSRYVSGTTRYVPRKLPGAARSCQELPGAVSQWMLIDFLRFSMVFEGQGCQEQDMLLFKLAG